MPRRHADAPVTAPRPATLLGWRLLSMFYDLWPALALWMVVGALSVAAFTLAGHAARENIAPFSLWQWATWVVCWGLTGVYATLSWRHGGQTLGMRPWRVALVPLSATTVPATGALWTRYAVGTLSLLLCGAGFWWALVDRQRLTWHDRASGTRLVRLPKR